MNEVSTPSDRLGRAVALLLAASMGAPALAADKKDLPKGDVVAKRVVNAPPSEVYSWLLDLEHHEKMWPEGCTSKWEYGTTRAGIGASAQLTYRVSTMRRRLTATLAEGDPDRYLKVDHAGRMGFATTWTLEDVDGGTRVEVHTWVDPPPWPLTATYMNRVRPEWKECHRGALDNLSRGVVSSR